MSYDDTKTKKPRKVDLPPLKRIMLDLNNEHAEVIKATATAVKHGIRCGELLKEAKDLLGHGNFLPWLKENFVGGERTAQVYMWLAANTQRAADFESIRAALAATEGPTSDIEALTNKETEKPSSSEALANWQEPAPFEIPRDHGIVLVPPNTSETFGVFTPHTDNNFVFYWSFEPNATNGDIVGGKKAVHRSVAWCVFKASSEIDWANAKIQRLSTDHKWSGPWDYNQALFLSREEWTADFLGHPTTAIQSTEQCSIFDAKSIRDAFKCLEDAKPELEVIIPEVVPEEKASPQPLRISGTYATPVITNGPPILTMRDDDAVKYHLSMACLAAKEKSLSGDELIEKLCILLPKFNLS